jgi:hypothetical protein
LAFFDSELAAFLFGRVPAHYLMRKIMLADSKRIIAYMDEIKMKS